MNEQAPFGATAKLAPGPAWVAEMVRPAADAGVGKPASFLRKPFAIGTPSGRETLRISALGLYRAFINGQRVGTDLLTPGWTAYDKRLSFQTYEVGDLLRPGQNTIDIWLADGWYRSQMMWAKSPIYNAWGSEIAAIAELRDGPGADGKVLLKTDGTWSSGLLPVRRSGIYFGEIYDARAEALAADSLSQAIGFDKAVLVAHETTPVRELAALAPTLTWIDAEGRTIHDFGQNTAGYVAFTVEGGAGARIIVEHSEIVDRDNNFDNRNYRSAEARIEYTLKGGAPESYRPIFTFQGFRYARVTITGEARITHIEAVPISSVQSPAAGFSSGHRLVDRLVENTLWSQRSNFIDVPTDCPQRDERLGWTGDAQVFAAAACYLHDSSSFLTKFLRDVMADQREDGAISHVSPDPTRLHADKFPGFFGSTGWGDAITVIPWTLYTHYGDKAILEETLPAMVRWVDYVWSISDAPIVRPPRAWDKRGFTFGDWLQPKGPSEKPLPTIGDDAAATIYLYISSVLTAKAAGVVGDTAIATRMTARAEAVKAAFAHEFITAAGRIANDDQTSYALAILYDLVPPDLLSAARENFKATIARSDGRIGTGFIGTPALLPALVKIGEPALAAAVFLQEEVPGWLYQVKNGATTIWERWDAIRADGTMFEPAMNSFNHYAYGAVCQWLFEAAAGFRPDEEMPGFRHVIFEPVIIAALGHVTAHHDSAAGRIEAAWTLEGDRTTYTVTVPQSAKGTLVLAETYRDAVVDGVPLATPGHEKARSLLAPGTHTITFRISSTGG
ncbi:MAG: family 78 glycoside hydrolase catalytic domain [Devosia nanyangense]|uniref:alpha-L-rhamnosidase n=1 Tax=Devosia nanyangense TaxID=1228055 RepID=A0A933L2P8_9HYPH|nr:family 78 glycoside hydrolase catalytic domain [Devosia nanyangense]